MHLSKFTLSAGLLCLVLLLATTEAAQPKADAAVDNSERNVGISLGKWNLGNWGGLSNLLGLGVSAPSSVPSSISLGTGLTTDNAASDSGTSLAIGIPSGTDALAGGLGAGALGAGALGAGALGAGALSTGALGLGAGALAVLKAYFKAFTFSRLVTMGMGAALLATGVGLIIAFGVLASELRRRSGFDFDSADEDDNNAQFRSTSDSIDWANLNILDYISMMEEMWRKFDVKDVECQKRVLCELHQNQASLGQPAEKVVNAFGYLRYLSFMKLPADLNSLFDEYQEAADKGRTFNKDCGEIYNACNFSFKDTYLKYVGNKNSL